MHINKLLRVSLVVTSFVAVSVSARARAEIYIHQSGATCHPYLGTNNKVANDWGGFVWNDADHPSTMFTAVCPVNMGWAPLNFAPVNGASLYYDDRTLSTPFSCTLIQRYSDGSISTSSKKYTCSLATGCPDSTEFSGVGVLSWNSSEIGMTEVMTSSSVAFRCDAAYQNIIRAYLLQNI